MKTTGTLVFDPNNVTMSNLNQAEDYTKLASPSRINSSILGVVASKVDRGTGGRIVSGSCLDQKSGKLYGRNESLKSIAGFKKTSSPLSKL